MLALFFIDLGAFYNEYSKNGESLYTFLTNDKVFNLESGEKIPASYIAQASFYNKQLVPKIWGALIFIWLALGIDYFIDPENHFITQIRARLKGFKMVD